MKPLTKKQIENAVTERSGRLENQTPTPWSFELSTVYQSEFDSFNNPENPVIVCSVINRADAAFIVRACNGVEAVLKTGDALLEKIGMVPCIEKERIAFIEALKAISND